MKTVTVVLALFLFFFILSINAIDEYDVTTVKLTKTASGYIVLWVNNDTVVKKKLFQTLSEARGFIQSFDGFNENPPKVLHSKVSFTKIEKAKNNFVLVWAFEGEQKPYQLTFPGLKDAKFFEQKFLEGEYSKSSFGHAINFHKTAPIPDESKTVIGKFAKLVRLWDE